jgi:hypothetical protein
LAGEFAQLYPDHPSPELLYFGFKVYSALHLGRQGWVDVNGQPIFGNFFVVVATATPHLHLAPVRDFFEPYPGPKVVSAGVTTAASAILPVRDRIEGYAKVHKKPDDDPEFRRTTMDDGEPEKRFLIEQPALLSPPCDASLLNCFSQAFHGAYQLASFVAPRAGGCLTATRVHLVVMTTCAPDKVVRLPQTFRDQSILLAPCTELVFGGVTPADQIKLRKIRRQFEYAMKRSPRTVTIDREASDLFKSLSVSGGQYVALKAIKLALNDALLEGSSTLTLSHASTALVHVHTTAALDATLASAPRTARIRSRVRQALRAIPGGLTRTELSRKLHGNYTSDEIGTVLGELARQGLAYSENHSVPARRGRPPERWFHRDEED